MNLLIKNALVIDANSNFNGKTVDIKIENGYIQSIENQIIDNSIKNISLENLHLSYGWFDSSVCFGEPGLEERETIKNGLNTSAKSGFTHVLVNPNTQPVIDQKTLVEFIQNKSKNFATEALVMGALTVNQKGEDLAELYDMHQSGAVAFGDYKHTVENANLLKIALQYTQNFNGLVVSFSSDTSIKGKGIVAESINTTRLGLKGIPTLAEEIIVSRNLMLLEYAGGKLHIPTVSSLKSLELIKQAKAKGLKVTCSISTHQLTLNDTVLEGFDTRYKVNPPLQEETIRSQYINYLIDGTIDCITSDHQPIDIEHKKVEFDKAKDGTIGLESSFTALNNHFPLELIVEKLTRAHNIFIGIQPKIAVGEKACFTLFNPEGTSVFTDKDILSSSKNSAFLNQKIKGKVYGIINNNQLIINE